MPIPLQVGDKIETKKPHPCGGSKWEILRCGMDFKLRCCGCGRIIQLSRKDVEKRLKRIVETKEIQP